MGTLTITDGTTTVNFLDTSGLHIARNGYRQGVGHPDPQSGFIPDVIDTLNCYWMDTTDDDRDTDMHNLQRLADKAQRYRRLRRNTGEVWMAIQTHSETNVRYHLVSDVQIDQLDGRHFGPSGPVDLVITITREGAGRAIAPTSTPSTIVSAQKYMKNDSDGNNGITLTPANVPGDAPMLTVIEINFGSTSPFPTQYMVAAKAFDGSTEASQFDPLFEPTSELDNTGLQTTDTNAPDDKKLRGTADTVLRWTLSSARPLSVYAGDYLVFAAFEISGAGSATAQFTHGSGYITQTATPIVSGGGTPATLHYLGRHRIPGGQYNPTLSNPATYDLKLIIDVTGLVTWDFFQMWLVPIGGNVMDLKNAAIDDAGTVVMDGIKNICYEKALLGGAWRESSGTQFDPRGRYIELEPGRYNRVFFFLAGQGNLVVFNWSFDVTLKGVARYLALRGDT